MWDMKLVDVFKDCPEAKISGSREVEVRGINLNSKKVQGGDIFVALRGKHTDGQKFIHEALTNGAVAVLSEAPLAALESLSVPVVTLPDLRKKLGVMASRIYGDPTQKLTVIGVTGTNGKTTVTCLIEHMLSAAGFKAGYIGTLGHKFDESLHAAERTTPEAPELQSILRQMVQSGVTHVVMECSSHGIEQGRLEGIEFDVAVFTNLTQDHLDDHQTMENYASIKRQLFDRLLKQSAKKNKTAIYNLDDALGAKWSAEDRQKNITFSIKNNKAAVCAADTLMDENGIKSEVALVDQKISVHAKLLGAYNLSNILAAVAAGQALSLSPQVIARAMSSFTHVPGRLEEVPSPQGLHVLVDYAHTDDAMLNVLSTLRAICKGKLVVVFGCGGNRDRAKRPKMMRAVEKYADEIVVTIDNPRMEEPAMIVEDILQGRQKQDVAVHVVLDRKMAIQRGIELLSSPRDMMIVTGKGHETYQEVRGEKLPFDDRQVAAGILEKMAGAAE